MKKYEQFTDELWWILDKRSFPQLSIQLWALINRGVIGEKTIQQILSEDIRYGKI